MFEFVKYLFYAFLLIYPLDLLSQKEPPNKIQICNHLVNLQESNSSFKSKKYSKKLIQTDIDYDSLVDHIKECDFFSQKKAERGFIEWEYLIDSIDYYTIVLIPNNYNPLKKYPVSFILHGAVSSLDQTKVRSYINPNTYNLDSLDRIVIYPAGWLHSPWWSERQANNFNYILRRIKQNYNIDENNIHLAGASDGGTGIIYQANLNITPWASFRPYISNPGSLGFMDNKTIYIKNLGNRPFLFISSEKDELFPPYLIESFLDKMKKGECKYNFILASGYKHEISWLTLYKDTISNFIRKNSRNPYPSTLFWQTDDKKYGRNHWVIINSLSNNTQLNNNEYPEIRPFKPTLENNSGIIEIKCNDNTINVKTINIKHYTLLLSPEQFNFDKEIIIYTNGELSFKGILKKDISVLLKWFNKDLDRTMLFGNELSIKIKNKKGY